MLSDGLEPATSREAGNSAGGPVYMRMVALAFARPKTTVAVLAVVGLAALALQAAFEWLPRFAVSQVLFLLFACMAVYAGWAISSRVLPQLQQVEEHLLSATAGRQASCLPAQIGEGLWLVILFTGVLVAIAAVYTHAVAGIPWTGLVRAVYFVSVFMNFWVLGAVIGLYGLALRWLWRLSWAGVSVTPFGWRPEIIAAAARTYLQITVIGIALYLLGLIAVWQSPGGRIFFAEGALVRELWILPLAIGVAGYFLVTQYLTHRILRNAKSARLAYLRARRNEAFSCWEEKRRAEDTEAFSFLSRALDEVSREGTWPLNLPRLVSVLIPVFVPAGKEIVELIGTVFGLQSA